MFTTDRKNGAKDLQDLHQAMVDRGVRIMIRPIEIDGELTVSLVAWIDGKTTFEGCVTRFTCEEALMEIPEVTRLIAY